MNELNFENGKELSLNISTKSNLIRKDKVVTGYDLDATDVETGKAVSNVKKITISIDGFNAIDATMEIVDGSLIQEASLLLSSLDISFTALPEFKSVRKT